MKTQSNTEKFFESKEFKTVNNALPKWEDKLLLKQLVYDAMKFGVNMAKSVLKEEK